VRDAAARAGARALASAARVNYWRRSGLIDPDRAELRQLKIIAALRRAGLSAQRVRSALDRLRLGPGAAEAPVAIAVCGREVYVRHRDGSWEGDSAPGQLVFAEFLPLRPLDVDAVPAAGRLPPRPVRARTGSGGPAVGAGTGSGPAAGAAAGPAGSAADIQRYLQRERALDPPSPPPSSSSPSPPPGPEPAQPAAPVRRSPGSAPGSRFPVPPASVPEPSEEPALEPALEPLWVRWLLPAPDDQRKR
jgi:hypothetical protein